MGTFYVVQAAAKHILEQKAGGSIVMIASMSGSVANKVSSHYISSILKSGWERREG